MYVHVHNTGTDHLAVGIDDSVSLVSEVTAQPGNFAVFDEQIHDPADAAHRVYKAAAFD